MSKVFAVILVILALVAPAQLQSPVSIVQNDRNLTVNFIKQFNDDERDIAYREMIGYMTQALRGEHFSPSENKILYQSRRTQIDPDAEFARMVLELRNLAIRVKQLEARQKKE